MSKLRNMSLGSLSGVECKFKFVLPKIMVQTSGTIVANCIFKTKCVMMLRGYNNNTGCGIKNS